MPRAEKSKTMEMRLFAPAIDRRAITASARRSGTQARGCPFFRLSAACLTQEIQLGQVPAGADNPVIMPSQTFLPGPTPSTVRTPSGQTLAVPNGWALLSPGDAALTRRVKAADEHWIVQERVGRKMFSRGVWAPAATIDRIREELAAERSTEAYARRREADSKRREVQQAEYVEDFQAAVLAFLAFHARHAELAQRLAKAVAEHATPVGSGTVARTKRIPIERRAEAAVIAWMRHQTTGYDSMKIARVKGQRREVRRMLAQRSKELLGAYRRGDAIAAACPLARALRPPQAQPA